MGSHTTRSFQAALTCGLVVLAVATAPPASAAEPTTIWVSATGSGNGRSATEPMSVQSLADLDLAPGTRVELTGAKSIDRTVVIDGADAGSPSQPVVVTTAVGSSVQLAPPPGQPAVRVVDATGVSVLDIDVAGTLAPAAVEVTTERTGEDRPEAVTVSGVVATGVDAGVTVTGTKVGAGVRGLRVAGVSVDSSASASVAVAGPADAPGNEPSHLDVRISGVQGPVRLGSVAGAVVDGRSAPSGVVAVSTTGASDVRILGAAGGPSPRGERSTPIPDPQPTTGTSTAPSPTTSSATNTPTASTPMTTATSPTTPASASPRPTASSGPASSTSSAVTPSPSSTTTPATSPTSSTANTASTKAPDVAMPGLPSVAAGVVVSTDQLPSALTAATGRRGAVVIVRSADAPDGAVRWSSTTATPGQIKAQIAAASAAGTPVLVQIGGDASDTVALATPEQATRFADSVVALHETTGITGAVLATDSTGSTWTKDAVSAAVTRISDQLGAGFTIGITTGIRGEHTGRALDLAAALGDRLDVLMPVLTGFGQAADGTLLGQVAVDKLGAISDAGLPTGKVMPVFGVGRSSTTSSAQVTDTAWSAIADEDLAGAAIALDTSSGETPTGADVAVVALARTWAAASSGPATSASPTATASAAASTIASSAAAPTRSTATSASPTPTSATMSMTTSPVSTLATTTPTAAPAPAGSGDNPTPGWASGSSGDAAWKGDFWTWRGSAGEAAGSWSDALSDKSTAEQAADQAIAPTWILGPGAHWGAWDGLMDLAPGGMVKGMTWAQAANGDLDAHWRAILESVKTSWGDRSYDLLNVRPFHEFNGNWMPWSVAAADLNDFRAGWARWAALQREILPGSHVVWSINAGTLQDYDIRSAYPGDDLVDVISIDSYNNYPYVTTADAFSAKVNAVQATGGPAGVASLFAFAKEHGKPAAVSEWSSDGNPSDNGGGDSPVFFEQMHKLFAQAAADGVLKYEILFDIPATDSYGISPGISTQPNASEAYRRLW